MSTLIQKLSLKTLFKAPTNPSFDLTPRMRAIVAFAGSVMSLLVMVALFRGLSGIAPTHPNARELAIVIHVASVLPAIPLGGYLLLAAKGTKIHKLLGKIWVALMITTATAAIFIQTSGTFSFIHIFVPTTYWASYRLIATARAGDLEEHKKQIIGLYLGALMIPGILSMALPGRLMNVWLLWIPTS